jgi:DNA-binding NarL/FixJ family response regulator
MGNLEGNDRVPRVLLVDDHAAFRAQVRRFLEDEGVQVVAEAGDGHGAMIAVACHAPDVAVVDVGRRPFNGLDISRRILLANPAIRVILHTEAPPSALAGEVRMRGVFAVLPKGDPAALLATVHRAGRAAAQV